MPSTMTMSNIAPTTMPAMAPAEIPLLPDTTFGVAGAGLTGVVLIVFGPGTAGVGSLMPDDELTVTYDTSRFVAIIVEAAAPVAV